MKVYGALEAAQIEWFTNAGKPAASSYPFRVIYVTDLKQIQVSDGTNWNPSALYTYTAGTLPAAGASNQYQVAFITDTLQVKVSNGTEWKTLGARLDTYTSGTIPAAASNTNSIIWVSDLQQVQVSNGSAWVQVGSKAGTKNYFSQNNANPDFETNSVSPWSACTLTFSSGVPSGAPTLTATQMSIATTATTPLSGTYSMLLTKAAANAQYQGFISGALTIDREDTAKVLYGSFYYEVVSGTIDLSGSSTQSLEIWIYNTVSGQWTQPAGYRGMNQSSGVGRVVFSFQTDGTYANNAYKIAVITQQTGTSAFVVEFDDFQVGPQAIVLGAAMTDWQPYTPTLTYINIGNGSVEGRWRRVGDSAEYQISVISGSTTTYSAGNFSFGLYPGHVIDLTKIPLSSSVPTSHGQAAVFKFGTARLGGTVCPNGSTAVQIYNPAGGTPANATVGADVLDNNSPYTWAGAGDTFSLEFKVPIAGWGSFSQMSSDTDTRVVAFYSNTPALTAGSIPVGVINFTSTSIDTHGAYQGSGVYKIPVSGQYVISVNGFKSTSVASEIYLTINGADVNLMSVSSASTNGTGQHIYNFKAGDTVSLKNHTASWVPAVTGWVSFDIYRLSGPSVITATETVACFYNTSSGQSIPNATETTVVFNSKIYDTHASMNTSTGVYTVPVSGKYSIASKILFNTFSWGTGQVANLVVYKNSTFVFALDRSDELASATTRFCSIGGSGTYFFNAGDTITVQVNQNTGAARTLWTDAIHTWICIERVGN